MFFQVLCKVVLVNPCILRLAEDNSLAKQPQDFVLPFCKLFTATTVSLPQSHLHFQAMYLPI